MQCCPYESLSLSRSAQRQGPCPCARRRPAQQERPGVDGVLLLGGAAEARGAPAQPVEPARGGHVVPLEPRKARRANQEDTFRLYIVSIRHYLVSMRYLPTCKFGKCLGRPALRPRGRPPGRCRPAGGRARARPAAPRGRTPAPSRRARRSSGPASQRRLGKPSFMCSVALLYAVFHSIPLGFEGSRCKIVQLQKSVRWPGQPKWLSISALVAGADAGPERRAAHRTEAPAARAPGLQRLDWAVREGFSTSNTNWESHRSCVLEAS